MSPSPPYVTLQVLILVAQAIIFVFVVALAVANWRLRRYQVQILQHLRQVFADLTAHRQYHELAYSIGPNREWIRCHRCGKTSYAPGDIRYLWCEKCGIFHARRRDDPVPVEGVDVP